MNNDYTNNNENLNGINLQFTLFQLQIYASELDQFFFIDNPAFNRIAEFDARGMAIIAEMRQPRRRERHSPSQKLNLQKYYQKSTEPIQNDHWDQEQPHIKVTSLRNTNVNNEYIINEFGLIGSQKNTNSKDILIGRSHRNQNPDLIPNDIILPDDRAISRIHCKIVCKDYFRKNQILERKYKLALKYINLSRCIKHKISQFLEEPKNAYIQDLGSIFGTYLRVFRQEPYLLSYDNKFSIGSETYFNIVLNETYKINSKEIDQQFYKTLKALSCLKLLQKHEIHLGDKQKQLEFQQLEEDVTNMGFKDLYNILKEYNVPILGIKFSGQGFDSNKQQYILVGKSNQDSDEFSIGRGADNTIKINSNTISRKQCRIKYSAQYQSWVISDGLQDRDSANGTWVSLQTVEQSERKKESNQILLKNNSEIKIGDFFLRVELVKGRNSNFRNQIKECCLFD
ncbi:unnamed protein product (macronuclear) [Paramecium tetraurelia]|uniref:FHA domain-containing protein n=1 Tax=Paramecium tetraurelia TaxID=5888 RepID=A0CZJ8_PARTE|nr:uncharacterized protein GSPATT00011788001 [Paramecium tetraurelia]CAK76215.1 unnamed protein product [Paramecium tetraurelia]|eukprot:XP_001443612.1 hypothetical protein (macronuclear) [Paramecium tetraurelia strain d4-2]